MGYYDDEITGGASTQVSPSDYYSKEVGGEPVALPVPKKRFFQPGRLIDAAKGIASAYTGVRKKVVNTTLDSEPYPFLPGIKISDFLSDKQVPVETPNPMSMFAPVPFNSMIPPTKRTTSTRQTAEDLGNLGFDTAVGAGAGKLIEGIPAAYKATSKALSGSFVDNPNIFTAIKRSPIDIFMKDEPVMRENLGKAESAIAGSIKSEKPTWARAINDIYGKKLDAVEGATKGDTYQAALKTKEYVDSLEPEFAGPLRRSKAYKAVNEVLSKHTPDEVSALSQNLSAPAPTDELGSPLDMTKLRGKPKVSATDPITGREFKVIRDSVKNAGDTPQDSHIAGEFMANLGEQAGKTDKGIAALNKDASGVYSYKRRAFKLFSGDQNDPKATEAIGKMVLDKANGKLTPEDAGLIKFLSHGQGDYPGMGPEIQQQFDALVEQAKNIKKMPYFKTVSGGAQALAISELLKVMGVNVGLFVSRILGHLAGR